jgi:molybdopterin-binding protein
MLCPACRAPHEEPIPAAENIFSGTTHRIIHGEVTTEVVVRIPHGTELCSIITEASAKQLRLKENDSLWIGFRTGLSILNQK